MTTLTISKTLTNEKELVLIPRKEYNSLLELKKIIQIINATKKEIADIKRGEKEIKKGEYILWSKLKHDLAHSRN